MTTITKQKSTGRPDDQSQCGKGVANHHPWWIHWWMVWVLMKLCSLRLNTTSTWIIRQSFLCLFTLSIKILQSSRWSQMERNGFWNQFLSVYQTIRLSDQKYNNIIVLFNYGFKHMMNNWVPMDRWWSLFACCDISKPMQQRVSGFLHDHCFSQHLHVGTSQAMAFLTGDVDSSGLSGYCRVYVWKTVLQLRSTTCSVCTRFTICAMAITKGGMPPVRKLYACLCERACNPILFVANQNGSRHVSSSKVSTKTVGAPAPANWIEKES